MQPLVLVLLLAAVPSQNSSPTKTAFSTKAAQRGERNPTVQRALEVLDSLIPLPAPWSLTPGQIRTWSDQPTWLTSLRERIRNLLSLQLKARHAAAMNANRNTR